MTMFLTEEQTMLRDSARPFLAGQAPVRHMRALRDAKDATGFSPALWQRFAELGFAGILVPEAEGGAGLGHVEAGIVLEEIGRNLTPSPFLATSVGAATALAGAAASQRARFLPRLARGELIASLAVDEQKRHRPVHIGLRAERAGNGFKLIGEKRCVPHGHAADLLLVAARTAGGDNDEDGVTLFLVERDAAGLAATPNRLADSSLAAHLHFDGVTVNADAVLGDVDAGRALLNRTLNALRAGAAAEMLGVGAGAMAMTMDYLKQRKQFGVAIGSFQALQHRAAHLYADMEVARAAVLKAQQLLDAGAPEAPRAVMVAKAMAGSATALAVQEGVQMHGGIGMTDEYDIGFFMKRQRVLAEFAGDVDYHTEEFARAAGY